MSAFLLGFPNNLNALDVRLGEYLGKNLPKIGELFPGLLDKKSENPGNIGGFIVGKNGEKGTGVLGGLLLEGPLKLKPR